MWSSKNGPWAQQVFTILLRRWWGSKSTEFGNNSVSRVKTWQVLNGWFKYAVCEVDRSSSKNHIGTSLVVTPSQIFGGLILCTWFNTNENVHQNQAVCRPWIRTELEGRHALCKHTITISFDLYPPSNWVERVIRFPFLIALSKKPKMS